MPDGRAAVATINYMDISMITGSQFCSDWRAINTLLAPGSMQPPPHYPIYEFR